MIGVQCIFQLLHACVFCTGYCSVATIEMPEGYPPLYLEADNVIGLTAGDIVLNIGDSLHVGEVANVDACNTW